MWGICKSDQSLREVSEVSPLNFLFCFFSFVLFFFFSFLFFFFFAVGFGFLKLFTNHMNNFRFCLHFLLQISS
jgi:hypothetical protein